jgi:hypothetical protein
MKNTTSAKTDYDAAMTALRTEYSGPVIGFEVGQYEILSDFDEWEEHKGCNNRQQY